MSEDAGPGGDVKPEDARPGDVEPEDAGPGDAEPEDAGPGDAEPGDVEPEDAGPGDVEPEDAGPGDAGPGNAELADSYVSSFERQKMEDAEVPVGCLSTHLVKMSVESKEKENKSWVTRRLCVVRVKDVLMEIQRYNGSHYVKNTKIQVPFYKDFFASLRNNRPLLYALYVANEIENKPFFEHNYCKRAQKSKPFLFMKGGFKKVRGKGRKKTTAPKTKPPPEKVSSKHKKYFLPSKSGNEQKKVSQKSKHPVLELDINCTQLKRTFSNSKRLQKKSPTRTKTLTESSSNLCSNRTKPSFIIDFSEKSNPQRNTIGSNDKTNDPGCISEKSSAKRHYQLLSKRTNVGYVHEQVRQERSRYPDWSLCYLMQRAAASHPPLADRKEL